MTRDEQDVISTASQWVDGKTLQYLRIRVFGRGKEVYGDLDIDGDERNYLKEASEELADATFYLACEVVRRRKDHRDPAMPALLGAFVGLVWRQLRGVL